MFGRVYDDGKVPVEITIKNNLNLKVHGLLTSYTSHRIFDDGWKLLTQTPFDAEEADIIIAGMAIWGMVFEDMKYNFGVQYYPQHSFSEVFQICFGTTDASHIPHDEIIKTIGCAALIDKKLDYDGTIPQFSCRDWNDRDLSELTKRFDKYHLPVPLPRAEVLRFLESSPAYKALVKMLPTTENLSSVNKTEWKIFRLQSALTIAELAAFAEVEYLDKTNSCRNTTVKNLTWAASFFRNAYYAEHYFIRLYDEINAYMELNKIAGLKPHPWSFG